ncbi:hypothetical protein KIH39_01295 [Telmatocola sphagniphila]|uniref:Uncharacterized protein n=1 Tax=Telmatocola sphagniphila TaxID=1123043 RepID=A0A8E6B745_9BACT|nr:hypothetical protein [Telmatocola sphagniphila]QVL32582.1 hypothetical protein KIH39_01295 [Telmatocola sphagniphila]
MKIILTSISAFAVLFACTGLASAHEIHRGHPAVIVKSRSYRPACETVIVNPAPVCTPAIVGVAAPPVCVPKVIIPSVHYRSFHNVHGWNHRR